MTIATTELTITGHEAAQVERANASSATPIGFVHGLWLLPYPLLGVLTKDVMPRLPALAGSPAFRGVAT
jgi:hypothetical protein